MVVGVVGLVGVIVLILNKQEQGHVQIHHHLVVEQLVLVQVLKLRVAKVVILL